MKFTPTPDEQAHIHELRRHLTPDQFDGLCDHALEQAAEELNAEVAAEALRPILREIAVRELCKRKRQ